MTFIPPYSRKPGRRKAPILEDGYKFDSPGERKRYRELKAMQAAGEIRGLDADKRRLHYKLVVNGKLISTYTPDFRYIEVATRKVVCEDVKSEITAMENAYVIRAKLFQALHPAIDFRETGYDKEKAAAKKTRKARAKKETWLETHRHDFVGSPINGKRCVKIIEGRFCDRGPKGEVHKMREEKPLFRTMMAVVLFFLAMTVEAAGRGRIARVLRVDNGDTITVAAPSLMFPGEIVMETVQLVGIDAPEPSYFGRPAECFAEYSADQLRAVLRDFDLPPGWVGWRGLEIRVHRVGQDSFGRTLAYVYLPSGKWPEGAARQLPNSLNLYMIANGYARADRERPHRYSKSYEIAETGARKWAGGIWANCKESPSTSGQP